MIPYSEIKKGDKIILNNQPHEIIEASLMFKGRGHSTMQARIKNLITGTIISETFHPSDRFEQAELEKIKVKFIYSNKGKYVFSYKKKPSKRFELKEEQIGAVSKFLKPGEMVDGLVFKDNVVNILLPIKISLKVAQAPPGVKGDTAQGGTKIVTLETGAEMAVPLFVEQGDTIEVNTAKGEYARRVKKK